MFLMVKMKIHPIYFIVYIVVIILKYIENGSKLFYFSIHEKPVRGSEDNWTFPGGDLLGKLLMQVRQELCTCKKYTD